MGLERPWLRCRLARLTLLATAAALPLSLALCTSGVADAESTHSLTIVSPSSLSLTASGKKPSTKTVIVSNDGKAVNALRFAAVPAGKVKVKASAQKIGAFSVRNFTVTLTPTHADQTFNGSLTVSGDDVAPAAITLSLTPKKAAPNWLYFLIFGTGGAALLFVAFRYCVFWVTQDKSHQPKLSTPLGPVNWDFSKSWASNLTVVGALLGTILAAGVLPEETGVTTATYAGLNLLFGILILVAPLAYVSMQREKRLKVVKDVTEPQYQGTVFWFLASSTLTLWAVSGELGTVGLLFRDIRSGQSLPEAAVIAMWILVIAAAVLLVVYAWTSIRAVLTDQIDLPKHRRRVRRRRTAEALAQVPVIVLEQADIDTLPLQERAAVQEAGGHVRVLAPEEELLPEAEIKPPLPSWSVI